MAGVNTVQLNNQYYDDMKSCFEWVIKNYSKEFPLFSVQNITDFSSNSF